MSRYQSKAICKERFRDILESDVFCANLFT